MALPFLGAAVLVGAEWLRTDVAAAGIRDDGVGPARDAQIEAAALDRREAEMSGRRQNAQALRHGDLRIIRNSARVGITSGLAGWAASILDLSTLARHDRGLGRVGEQEKRK